MNIELTEQESEFLKYLLEDYVADEKISNTSKAIINGIIKKLTK